MRTQMKITKTAMAALAGLMVSAAQGAPVVQTINVTVNGAPVAFNNTVPFEMNGTVLVPLRDIFQALGASVQYNPTTKIVNAKKGTANIVLPLGSKTAFVDGRPQPLDLAAQEVNGTTLVPLRFIAQALGARVDWSEASNTVAISTMEAHLSTLPPPPGIGDVTGQVTGIYTNTNPPQITIRVNGENTSVPLAADTSYLRVGPSAFSTGIALSQINPGDQVTIHRGPGGIAQSVSVSYNELRGTIKTIAAANDGSYLVTLDDGAVVTLEAGSPIVMAHRHLNMSDVMPGELVVIRTDPNTKEGYEMVIVTGNKPPAQ